MSERQPFDGSLNDRMGETLFPGVRARIEKEKAEAEARNAEALAKREVAALLKERADVEKHREQILAETPPTEQLVVVGPDGTDTDLRVERRGIPEWNARRDRDLRQIGDSPQLIAQQLRHRGYRDE